MARPKLGESDSKRLQMVITEDELAAISEWQHSNRVASKSEAIRRLCQIGLLVDQELEQFVDTAGDGVDILQGHFSKLYEVFRLVINRETYGKTFDRDQLWDVLTLAIDQTHQAEEGLRALHTMLVTLYNAIVAMAEARSMEGATRKSAAIIRKANSDVERAERRKAKMDASAQENRYLSLIFAGEKANERDAYEALSERKKDQYLKQKISALKEEDLSDPVAFAERYGIDLRKFWEKPEWQEFLEKRAIERDIEDNVK